ncbi:MAG: NAD-dependent epimerase/dehydratase family protein, partial [Williamsia herbipolensis]|nr:NAD-dependent epimerase/dehydratase family protein [Williamsia herbipolensis]
MSDRHVVVGAGPVGKHLASLLAARGDEVVVATRSGRDTGIDGVRHVAVDAADPVALGALVDGAASMVNCVNPGDYTQWEQAWPPVAASMLAAAERVGVYAITGNLYPYGPVDAPMTESMPDAAIDHKGRLRARMWADALAAHDAGRIRTVEVRGSDYVGTGIGENGHVSRNLPAALAGRRATMIGRTDQPHTFTDVLDVARLLVATIDAPDTHGRTWHVPSNAPRTNAQALTEVLAVAGKPAVPVSAVPAAMVRAIGIVNPMMRELGQMTYQWTRPYVLDDTAARERFAMQPTPWDEVCRRTLVGVEPA